MYEIVRLQTTPPQSIRLRGRERNGRADVICSRILHSKSYDARWAFTFFLRQTCTVPKHQHGGITTFSCLRLTFRQFNLRLNSVCLLKIAVGISISNLFLFFCLFPPNHGAYISLCTAVLMHKSNCSVSCCLDEVTGKKLKLVSMHNLNLYNVLSYYIFWLVLGAVDFLWIRCWKQYCQSHSVNSYCKNNDLVLLYYENYCRYYHLYQPNN